MRLSFPTLRIVAIIMAGDTPPRQSVPISPPRTTAEVVDLFDEYCGEDNEIYWRDRTTQEYCVARLRQANGSTILDKIVCATLKFWEQKDIFDPKRAARCLNEYFWQDGYELVFCQRPASLASNKKVKRLPYFEVREIVEVSIGDELRAFLDRGALTAQVDRTKQRLAQGDYAGSITGSYTLVEGFLKALLRQLAQHFNHNEGDITALHKIAAQALGLAPSGDAIGRVAQGLVTQVGNLYGLANKAGDRHDAKHKPGRHHAKLAVNVAFTYCEFLLETFEARQQTTTDEPVG